MSDSSVGLPVLLAALRKLWWVVVIGGVLGAAGSLGYSSLQTPLYTATSSLHFSITQGSSATDLNQGASYTQSQMLSYAQLVEGSLVLQPVIDDLDLETTPSELSRSISVSIPRDTSTMKITATATDPQRAADLAAASSEHLIEVLDEEGSKTADGSPSVTVAIYDEAVPPRYQSSPDKTRDAFLGGVIGGMVGIAAALLIALLDTRVRNEEILVEAGGDPVLGVVSKAPLLQARTLAVALEPLSRTAEDFHRIRSALTYANVSSRVRVLLVTAGMPGEGKSTISVNLAMTLAGLRHSVLLIDADLRRPRVHLHAGIDGSVGLTNVLLEQVSLDVATHSVSGTTLDVLPSGEIPPNPAEILTSHRMEELIAAVSSKYDYVIIDTPPTLSVADANLLAPIADGVLLVVDATKTRRAALAESMKTLEMGGARILGTVLNRARPARRRDSYYAES
ncbi:polysaccharide biosynthesis tyrosine autokinase [Brachybacterium sp.]|uniref:polysaccharide biosynthesis tyrosine autokinase n=1 Tax=Brachybacterium sp. TaxID=1891286 RepID=UPI003F909F28